MKLIKTIMLVDDDPLQLFLTKKIIEKSKITDNVEVFTSGLEGMKFLLSRSNTPESLPEVILLDINMPVMDGWQFINEYMKLDESHRAFMKIFVLSSSINEEEIDRIKSTSELGGFISKPLRSEDFTKITETLNLHF